MNRPRSIYILFGSSLDANTASAARIKNYYNNIDKDQYRAQIRSLQDYRLYKKFDLSFKDMLIFRFVFELVFSILIAFQLIFESKKDDIVLISTPPFFLTLSGLIIDKLSTRRVIYDVRDIYPHTFLWKNVLSEKSILYKLLYNLAAIAYRNKTCICATNGIADYIERDFECKRVGRHLNGTSLPTMNSKEKKLEQAGKLSIIFHGTLGKLQNKDYLIKLIRSCSRVKFKIFTDLKRLNPKDFEALDNVEISDRVSLDELAEEIQSSHLLISLRDESELTKVSNPVKVFDGLSQGTPALVIPSSEITTHTETSQLLKAFDYNDFENLVEFINCCEADFEFYRTSFPKFGIGTRDFERPKNLPEFFVEELKCIE